MEIFYHNITKRIFNETDETDLIDNYSEGDLIMKSRAGNALIVELDEGELKEIYTNYVTRGDEDFEEYDEGE